MMRTAFDRVADALYISFRARAKVHNTEHASHDVAVDFDSDGRVVGIEILNARMHIGPAVDKIPAAGEMLSLAEAESRSGRSSSTLRGQIHKGKLEGEKIGRDWFVNATSLENYLEAVESGRDSATEKPKPTRRRRKAVR